VGKQGSKRGWHGRSGLWGPRRAALAGLVLGAALWNFAGLCQLAAGLLAGAPVSRGEAPSEGCTSLELDRPTGRTLGAPCSEATAWMESALRAHPAWAGLP
jgi:hypothetical protein